MTFLGIDIGSSFIKGSLLDLDRPRLRHIRRVPFPDPLGGLPALFHEYDPQAVVQAVSSLLKDLLAAADEEESPVEGLVLCSQMHGLVLTSAEGRPFSNLATWQDQRGLMPHPSGKGSYFDVLSQRISPDERRQLGNELRPGLPVVLLFWLAEQGLLPAGEGRSFGKGFSEVFPAASARLHPGQPVPGQAGNGNHPCHVARAVEPGDPGMAFRGHRPFRAGWLGLAGDCPAWQGGWPVEDRRPDHPVLHAGWRLPGGHPGKPVEARRVIAQYFHRVAGQHAPARVRIWRFPDVAVLRWAIPGQHHPHPGRAIAQPAGAAALGAG